MTRKLLLTVGSVCLLAAMLMVTGVVDVSGQGGDEFPPHPIRTAANSVVGIGDWVAVEAYGVAAGENPEEQPAVAMPLPYGIIPNLGLENIEDFVQPEPLVEGFTFSWELVAPEGSSAELIEGNVAIFKADVEGTYALTLNLVDPNGNEASTTWNVTATTYVGVGGLTADAPQFPECGTCHAEVAEAWYQTGHATQLTLALEGEYSSHFGARCVYCHSNGFNNEPGADAGGFDDVAREAGWTWPAEEEIGPGAWAALVEEHPSVAAMANVQCESCHGPGQMHVTQGIANPDNLMISSGLEYGTCTQCHGLDPYHVVGVQWENSAHADKNAQAFTYPIGEGREGCATCHSGYGYVAAAAGVPVEELPTTYQPITCAVCHDPHDANSPGQLRVFDSVVLPNGLEVSDAGASATCMTCHNTRRDAVSTVQGAVESGRFSTPHYSSAGELMFNTGAYTWGETLPFTPHGDLVEGTCTSCHMAESPGLDAERNPLPGHNEVGGHSFAMESADGFLFTAVCEDCHGPMDSFALMSRGDYDGDGEVEMTDAEIEGLLELVEATAVEAGLVVLDHHPYYEFPEGADENLYGAVWNLKLAQDGAAAVHNFKYTVASLQLSYEKLTGEAVPGADILPREPAMEMEAE